MSYQKITIVGHLGQDPEARYTPNGQQVTSFSVATTNQYTNKQGERIKTTTWFRVSVWGGQAESCAKYLQKGSRVLVEGRMSPDKETGTPRIWQDAQQQPRASYEIQARDVVFLTSQGQNGDGAAQRHPVEDSADNNDPPF